MGVDDELHASAIERRDDALARERHARACEAQARQEADEATSPDLRRMHEYESEMYARAARLHHQAAEIQSEHADAHPAGAEGSGPGE